MDNILNITRIFNASAEVHSVSTLATERSYTIVGVEENQSVSGEGPHRLQRNTFPERWICGLHEVMHAIDIASIPYMNSQQLSVLNERKVENMLTLEHFR